MQDLPQAFLEKMKVLLGGEYEMFLAAAGEHLKNIAGGITGAGALPSHKNSLDRKWIFL